MGLPSLMSCASIMATLWSMVVEWSVLSAELHTNVPRSKTAAQRTCGRGQVTAPPTLALGLELLQSPLCQRCLGEREETGEGQHGALATLA